MTAGKVRLRFVEREHLIVGLGSLQTLIDTTLSSR